MNHDNKTKPVVMGKKNREPFHSVKANDRSSFLAHDMSQFDFSGALETIIPNKLTYIHARILSLSFYTELENGAY